MKASVRLKMRNQWAWLTQHEKAEVQPVHRVSIISRPLARDIKFTPLAELLQNMGLTYALGGTTLGLTVVGLCELDR